jgi:hypothetical protein
MGEVGFEAELATIEGFGIGQVAHAQERDCAPDHDFLLMYDETLN